jgi:hypothetical protein
VFKNAYAPATPGSFQLRPCPQLDALASRVLTGLVAQAPLVAAGQPDPWVLVDVDDTIIEVHGHAKQSSGFGFAPLDDTDAHRLFRLVTAA